MVVERELSPEAYVERCGLIYGPAAAIVQVEVMEPKHVADGAPFEAEYKDLYKLPRSASAAA
jgi:hypothetical protein